MISKTEISLRYSSLCRRRLPSSRVTSCRLV